MQILEEDRLSLGQAARREKVHPGTIFRWITDGLRGGKVKLESFKRGGRTFTSVQAIERFYARLSPECADKARQGHRKHSHELAEQACNEAGF